MNKKFLLLAAFFLTTCSSSGDKTARICPQVAAVRELAQVADFARAETTDIHDLVAAGKIESISGECSFGKDSIEIAIAAHMLARRGAALGGNQVEFPYFAALLDKNGQPIAKQNLSARFRFSGKEDRAEITEELKIKIPSPHGGDWRVLLGFQLSPQQLAFNRAQKAAAP